MIGHSLFELVHPEDKLSVMKSFHKALASGVKQKTIEFSNIRSGGSYGWLEATGTVKRDYDGNIIKLYFASRDITALKGHY